MYNQRLHRAEPNVASFYWGGSPFPHPHLSLRLDETLASLCDRVHICRWWYVSDVCHSILCTGISVFSAVDWHIWHACVFKKQKCQAVGWAERFHALMAPDSFNATICTNRCVCFRRQWVHHGFLESSEYFRSTRMA